MISLPQSSMAKPVTIVAVHGVGDATPGHVSRDLSEALTSTNTGAFFERHDLFVNGICYPRLRAYHTKLNTGSVHQIVEVNWADVLRPADSATGVLRHIFLMMAGMRNLAVDPSAKGLSFAKVYFWLLECTLFWGALLAMFVMLLASCGSNHPCWLWVLTVVVPILVPIIAAGLKKYDMGFGSGYFVWPIFLIAGLSFVCPTALFPPESCVFWSAKLYVGAQCLVGFALTLGFFQTLFSSEGKASWQQRFTRGALLWIPFLVFCGVAVGGWAGVLLLGSKGLDAQAHAGWQATFLQALGYDLFWSEVGTLISVIFTFLLLPVIGLCAYLWPAFRSFLCLPKKASEAAHLIYAIILAVGPFALFAGGMVFWITLFTGPSKESSTETVLAVYSLSALRLSALLPSLIPVARIILDVAGDVIYHIQPNTSSPVSSKLETESRLLSVLQEIRRQRPGDAIAVVAHSQGSIIAWSVLQNDPALADRFLTMGSPLTNLYACLLGGVYGQALPSGVVRVPWTNIYRDGDYIGAAVSGAAPNIPIGIGGHTEYWKDPRILPYI